MATATLPPLVSEAGRLTEAHRLAQARQAAIVALIVSRYWSTRVKWDDPAAVERWLALVVPAILSASARSANMAAVFGTTVRTLETRATDGHRFESLPGSVEAAIRTSLSVTGPRHMQSTLEKVSGLDISPELEQAIMDQARKDAATGVGGAAARHAMSGGRNTLIGGARDDRLALGWVRVTKASPCYFCAMLASRGPTYSHSSFVESNSFFDGPGDIKVHDSCACSLKPVYRRDDEVLKRSKGFSDLWASSTVGKSGKAAILEFRRAYEGR